MAADMIKDRIDYKTFKSILQKIEWELTYTNIFLLEKHGENKQLIAEMEELISTTNKMMEIFGIQPVKPKE